MQKRISNGVLFGSFVSILFLSILSFSFSSAIEPVCGDGDCEVGEACYIDCEYEYPGITREPISYNSLDVANRTLYTNRYDNETGNYHVIELHPVPTNFDNGTEFVPIEPNISVDNCEYDHCVRKGLHHVDFKNSSTSGFVSKFSFNGSNISYKPLALKYVENSSEELISNVLSVQGDAEGSSFTYAGIYGSGFDLTYDYKNVLLKKTLRIEGPSDLPDPISLQDPDLRLAFEFSFNDNVYDNVEEVVWDESSELSIDKKADIVDSLNKTLFSLLPPYAYDSNYSIIELDYTFENIGGNLVVSIKAPYSWLANETRVYPVFIDPSTSNVFLDSDLHGWVSRQVPEELYDFFSNDDSDLIRLGVEDLGASFRRNRGYVLWANDLDFAQLANENILAVDLAWEVNGGLLGPGIDNDIQMRSLDPTLPGTILFPSNQDQMQDLYGAITTAGPLLSEEEDIQNTGSYRTPLGPEAVTELEDRLESVGQPFNIGFRGECCQPNDGFVSFKGVGSNNPPFLIVEIKDPPQCGNGIIESGEQCDDEDTQNGDGCSQTCQIESGWSCSGEPSVCQPNCPVPDGSSYDCHCENNSDCPAGLTCEESSGPDACIPVSTCSGTIAVITEDSSGNALENLTVYHEGSQQGQTDGLGSYEIDLQDETCGDPQNVEVRCEDDVTVCGTQSTSLDDPNDPDYDSLLFSCDICLPEVNDLFVEQDDISFADDQAGDINISITIHSLNVNANNVDVDISCIDNGDFISRETISVVQNSEDYLVSVSDDLSGCGKINVQVDPDNEVDESDEENNNAEQFVIDPVDAYLSVNTGYSLVDDTIEDFVDDFVQPVSQNDAQIEIHVGKNLAPGSISDDWGLQNDFVYFNGLQEGVPYNGIVGKRFDGQNEKPRVYVFGNEIDGTTAAIRKLIDERVDFLNENTLNEDADTTYLGETDIDAISVFDYMHTDENQANYRINNESFAEVIDNVLRRNTFNLAIRRVATANDNTVLRMKNINQELSPAFRNFSNSRPVVLGTPLFGNLFSMEKLGLKIARDDKFSKQHIRDVWLAEHSGGPNTDCELCPNYNYSDLVDYYWPALIGGVIQYTGQSSVDYIGYSAAGGLGLKSFEKWKDGKPGAGLYVDENGDWMPFNLPQDSVDHMVALAPMGAFDGNTTFVTCMERYGEEINDFISFFGHDRVDRSLVSSALFIASVGEDDICAELAFSVFTLLPSGNKVSFNFWQDIINDVVNKSDSNPVLSNINELLVIRGAPFILSDNDGIIPNEDINEIYNGSVANEKYKARIVSFHGGMQNKDSTYDPLIAKFLNDQNYNLLDRGKYLIESLP